MEIVDTAPDVAVAEAEYVRLLGFPRGHVLEGRARELADWARDWFVARGRPWVYARPVAQVSVHADGVVMDRLTFRSPRLERMFRDAGADGAVVVAVSAGAELENAAHQAWRDEKPDEYFFLEMFGSAVVEHLITTTGARLCAWADPQAMAVLPHYSPGYTDWDISEQSRVATLLDVDRLPGTLDVLESGMLRPKKSLLAVFGLTRRLDRVTPLSGLAPCASCSFMPCQYRRAPYRRSTPPAALAASAEPATPTPTYGTSVRALSRWAAERLTMSDRPDGGIDAVFHYEGSTCSNMGRPLRVEYHVTLGTRAAGFPIRSQVCAPAGDDEGCRAMCEFIRAGDAFLAAVGTEAPLVGRPLDDVLTWQRPRLGPSCLCEASSREHKWGLVLETIHYALRQEPRT